MANTNLLATYSPEEVSIIISNKNFSHQITGTIEGSFCTVERIRPSTSFVDASDGNAMRVRRKSRNCNIKISLVFGSNSNDLLGQLLRNDENASNNDWLFSILIKDNSGRSLHYSSQAYIENEPTSGYTVEGEAREWTIFALNVQGGVGGNAPYTPDEASTLEAIGGVVDSKWKSSN